MTEENQQKSEHAKREERILEFWNKNQIFQKTLDKKPQKGNFVFYEGPPTANGKPGIHHLEARAFKDVIPRYKTMQGYFVRRKAGWDTHGLPVEIGIEKELGFKSKKEIEEYGIAAFNKKCKESVFKYIDLWSNFTDRIGYWLDKKNAYFTFDSNYIESLWNIFKKIDDQKLLYKDYKVVPWCPRCGTTLSSHELAQGYQEDKDLSVYVKFRIVEPQSHSLRSPLAKSPVSSSALTDSEVSDKSRMLRATFAEQNEARDSETTQTYLLTWTTTPWTLPGNVALAVGEKIDYVKIKIAEEFLILAKDRLAVIVGEYEIIEEIKGKDLVGLEYEPVYPFITGNENSFKVYAADFVNTEDGTGIVHIAPMYGADDFELGNKNNLPKQHLVNEDGTFKSEVEFLAGRFVKDEETAVEIIKDLAHRGLLFKKEKHTHQYPHCWRCGTPLIYFARDSWYIKMSALREKLVSENEKINWEPEYIKEGRFGEWLREVKDWAISRERYWGTPLPIWFGEDGEKLVVDSIETLKKYTKKSGNKYFLMRHGEAEHNIEGVFSSDEEKVHHLTENGTKQAEKTAGKLKKEKIDLIIYSPLTRAKETMEEVKKILGENILAVEDKRVTEEIFAGLSGMKEKEFKNHFPTFEDRLHNSVQNSETLLETKNRVGEFLYDLENKYQNKNILVVTHGGPISLMFCASNGLLEKDIKENYSGNFIMPGEYTELKFTPLPHNENFELDLHKPFIDEIELVSDSGKLLKRIKEVCDVWFDSGSMPFAQDHYPFENKELIDKNGGYPADFISEAIDQTRGWFYTLHAVGVLTGKGNAYKNVICLGHLLDKNGKKMSKSLGNVVDPWVEMDKFGADAIRLWMYSVNQPGESKNYDEKTVDEIIKKNFNLLSNVYAFYELYRDKDLETNAAPKSKNALDMWILARLNQLINEGTNYLEDYRLLQPVRMLKEFIEDLSTWYLRRSREKIREGDKNAKQCLYFVLKTLSKYMAPFAPFFAEDLYQKLRLEDDFESVHLESWPHFAKASRGEPDKIIEEMKKFRSVVSLALEARQKANIKVRQPLAKLSLKEKVSDEYAQIIKDEINVKEVVIDSSIQNEIELDTNITDELKEEGMAREIIRAIQDARKEKNLSPNDTVAINISAPEETIMLVKKYQKEIQKPTSVEIKELKNSVELKIEIL